MSLLVGTFLMLINYGDTLWERGYLIKNEIIKNFSNLSGSLLGFNFFKCGGIQTPPFRAQRN